MQQLARLSDEEQKNLDQVATEYLRQLDSYKERLQAARLPYWKLALDLLARQNGNMAGSELAEAKKPIVEIQTRMDAAVVQAIQRLRAGMGQEGFARLDAFVRQTFKVTQTHAPATTARLASLPKEVTR